MMLFATALPGRFGDWCDSAIARMAESALGPVVLTGANTAEDLASELIKTEGQHFYVGARQPGRWLRERLSDTKKKFVVALDDPRDAVSDLILRHRLEIPEATRRVASSCAAMTRFMGLHGALVVSAERDWRNPVATMAVMADHLGLPIVTDDIERIASELEAAGLGSSSDPGESWSVQMSEVNLGVIDGALAPYAEYFKGAPLGQITWARDLFREEHHQSAAHPVEISGPIRYLIYGPYITLPPGNWIADMVLGFSEDAVDMGFRVEVWAGSQLNTANVRPSSPGIISANVSFVIEEPNDSLVEIRVLNERAAIYGRLALAHATLTPRQDVPASIADRLRTELGLSRDGVGAP